MSELKTNHLSQATSPYLRQHAQNPVDWYPWSAEALDKALKENKPILLSIGYAACHWCHVMAHESFEDPETAQLMNDLFVNIKIDREERPDLDKVYQTAHYVLTQQGGGWPLTIFLTPGDLTPFYSGTYFPREARYQLPAFKEVLKTLAKVYHEQPEAIKQQNAELRRVIQLEHPPLATVTLNDEPLQKAFEELQHTYDAANGGFHGAPKFPHPSKLAFLLKRKSNMATDTLEHLANGGIQDQLAGGFFRYSVDKRWEIPHFEKMLYDNGQLLTLFIQASTQSSLFQPTAKAIAHWTLEKMSASHGGYYASIDADSEGHEGQFYTWTRNEVEAILTPAEYSIVQLYFGLDQPPNFEGRWHLYVAKSLEEVAVLLHFSKADVEAQLNTAKQKLLAAREMRVAPDIDHKILTSWNSLMMKGLFIAGSALGEPGLIQSAKKTLSFIREKMWRNHRLFASAFENQVELPAYLDDYAFLIDALLTSLQFEWESEQLQFVIALADVLMTQFFDEENGGFYFTAHEHEKLLYRPKSMMDEALPSGNGIAAKVLLILGHLLGDTRYINAAEKTLLAAWVLLLKFPAEHCSLLMALDEYLHPTPIIILRGNLEELKTWRTVVNQSEIILFAIPQDANGLPEQLALKKSHGNVCAYICKGMQCSEVITDLETFKQSLH